MIIDFSQNNQLRAGSPHFLSSFRSFGMVNAFIAFCRQARMRLAFILVFFAAAASAHIPRPALNASALSGAAKKIVSSNSKIEDSNSLTFFNLLIYVQAMSSANPASVCTTAGVCTTQRQPITTTKMRWTFARARESLRRQSTTLT